MNLTNPRAAVEVLSDGMLITIKPPKFWPVLIFLFVWLAGWTIGEVFAIRSLLSGGDELVASAFLVIWLLGWSVGGAFAWLMFLFMAFGRERILIQSGVVHIRKEVLGIGRTRRFERSLIRNLRLRVVSESQVRRTKNAERLSFDYEGKIVNFGIVIADEEANELLQLLRGRLG